MDAMQLLASVIGSTTADAAERFAGARIPVFPCVPGEKRPLTRHGFHDATTNPAQVARWWRDWPDANIGLPTGSISGWEAVDVDMHGPVRGFGSFDLARREGLVDRWAALVRTPSGGIHAYYPADPAQRQPSWQVASAGIDFRGEGGYVLVPPSRVRVEGTLVSYELVGAGHGRAVPVDAAGLRQFLDPRPAPAEAVRFAADASPGFDVERIASWVAARGEGERNRGLFWAACRMTIAPPAPRSPASARPPPSQSPTCASPPRSRPSAAAATRASPSPRSGKPTSARRKS